MALNYTSEKLSLDNAERFRDSFSDADPSIQYIFVGNHIPYSNELFPPNIVETISSEKAVWDNMFAAKRVYASDVELVIPKVEWTADTKYRQYDDTITLSDLITENTSQNLKPFYIITSGRNVYKCLSNNFSANSTVEPTGDYSTSNGAISTADGYIWKYMYNVKSSNRFLNVDWIPTPTRNTQTSELSDYSLDNTGVVEGELTTVVITNGGSGYYETNVEVTAFESGCSILTVANTTNLAANMAITGTGIATGTLITVLDTSNSKITLSSATISSGGGIGSGSNVEVSTRVYFDGDGTNAEASATLEDGSISKITITTIGTGYSRANVLIFGSGSGASARAIIAPKYGHAKNPAKDLLAKNVMLTSRIGEVDSSENGVISTDTSFRQFGLLRNPHKYEQSGRVNNLTANAVISQARTLTATPGASYTLNEYVYQITANTVVAYGYVYSQTTNSIKVTNVKGNFTLGLSLIGASSGTSRTIVALANPEFEPYSGDILYVENIEKIDREDGQAENIKFVIQF